jgi:hypothetical protein
MTALFLGLGMTLLVYYSIHLYLVAFIVKI